MENFAGTCYGIWKITLENRTGKESTMKFCIIGSRGHIGYVFQSIGKVPGITLDGISSGCEDDPARLVRSSADAGFTPELYSDWRQMLDRLSPGLVAVDGPFDRHAEMAAYALERGIHVFCEKPIALTLTDLDRIMAAQKRSGCRIISMVGLRYQADFQYALQLVRAGAVGKVKMVRAQKSYRLGTRPEYYRRRESYGGTIPWVGSHAIDWIMAFAGSAFRQVYATQTAEDNFGNGDLEIACQCLFVMKNGVQGQASIDFLRPAAAPSHGDDRVRVAGTEGILEVIGGKVILIDKDGRRELPVPPPERELFSDFANSLTGKSRCLVTESETFELTRACLLARESADTGKVIEF